MFTDDVLLFIDIFLYWYYIFIDILIGYYIINYHITSHWIVDLITTHLQSLQQTQYSISGYVQSPLSPSTTLNVPAFTFAPMFKTSYLSSPVKKIVYSDTCKYSVPSTAAGQTFNQLTSNGIANIKSVKLCTPYVFIVKVASRLKWSSSISTTLCLYYFPFTWFAEQLLWWIGKGHYH